MLHWLEARHQAGLLAGEVTTQAQGPKAARTPGAVLELPVTAVTGGWCPEQAEPGEPCSWHGHGHSTGRAGLPQMALGTQGLSVVPF